MYTDHSFLVLCMSDNVLLQTRHLDTILQHFWLLILLPMGLMSSAEWFVDWMSDMAEITLKLIT